MAALEAAPWATRPSGRDRAPGELLADRSAFRVTSPLFVWETQVLAPGVPALKSETLVSMKLRLAVVKLQVSSAPSGGPVGVRDGARHRDVVDRARIEVGVRINRRRVPA